MSQAGDEGTTTFSTPSEREIHVYRAIPARRSLVFEVWTRPEHLPHWLTGPGGWLMTVCEIDLRVGGKWELAWRHADGNEMAMRGAYREVVPPERVVSIESWGGDWPETRNTVVFGDEDGLTTLSQTILYPSKEARDAALQTGMKEGMAASFRRLDSYLQSLA